MHRRNHGGEDRPEHYWNRPTRRGRRAQTAAMPRDKLNTSHVVLQEEERSTIVCNAPGETICTGIGGENAPVYLFQLVIEDRSPRRLLIPSKFNFHQLHMAVCAAMGWTSRIAFHSFTAFRGEALCHRTRFDSSKPHESTPKEETLELTDFFPKLYQSVLYTNKDYSMRVAVLFEAGVFTENPLNEYPLWWRTSEDRLSSQRLLPTATRQSTYRRYLADNKDR